MLVSFLFLVAGPDGSGGIRIVFLSVVGGLPARYKFLGACKNGCNFGVEFLIWQVVKSVIVISIIYV